MLITIAEFYVNLVFGEFDYLCQSAICPSLLLIVACEHNLGTNFQSEIQFYRQFLVVELPRNSSLVSELLCINLSQTLLVDPICGFVERCQRDNHLVFVLWLCHTLIEVHDVFWGYLVHANILQDMKELLVIVLTIYLLEFNLHETHAFDSICLVEEEIICLVDVVEKFTLCPLSHNWWQLKYITNEDDLLTTEGLCCAKRSAESVVDGIHDVTSYH